MEVDIGDFQRINKNISQVEFGKFMLAVQPYTESFDSRIFMALTSVFRNPQKTSSPVNQITNNSDSIIQHTNNKIAKTDTGTASSSKINKSNNSSLHQDELAINMIESPIFESLISSHCRSSDFEVCFPGLGQQFGYNKTIEFRFEGNIIKNLCLLNKAGG